MNWSMLHDAVLERLELAWESGTTMIVVRYQGARDGRTGAIKCTGTRCVHCPRDFPWGPSVAINEVRVNASQESTRVEIEVQSGDTLVVVASAVIFEE